MATFIDLSGSTLNSIGIDTTSSSYTTALSVQANIGGDVLVVGTFSNEEAGKVGTGSWQLSYGGQTSKSISRTLDSKNDIGMASVVHVFSGVTAGSAINLQHRTDAGATLTTKDANLIAIPLTTSTGEQLNHSIHQQGAGFQTSAASFAATGVQTSLQLDRTSNNGVYIAASFNAQTISGAETGTWQLQYRVDGGSWVGVGAEMKRTMNTIGDQGAITMYALAEDLPPGTCEVQLVAKSDAGQTVETVNATLAAVALSYDNAEGGGYFDGFAMEDTTMSPVEGPYDGVQSTLYLEDNNTDVFSSMSFYSSAQVGANQIAAFDLWATNSTQEVANQTSERFYSGTTDYGSGGSAALYQNMSSGDLTVFGRYDLQAGQVAVGEVSLVGFSTEAIPEPMVLSFIGLFGGGMLIARRIFAR